MRAALASWLYAWAAVCNAVSRCDSWLCDYGDDS